MPEFPVDPVIDAHVHLMPDRLMAAIRDSLAESAGWSFPHPTDREGILSVLTDAGVDRFVALPYVARPGGAADLNQWVCERAAESDRVVPFATVHAGEDDVGGTLREAIAAGARGLKFQLPVQGFAADDPRLSPAYDVALEHDIPVVFHAGTAPMFRESPHVGVDRFQSFLDSYPEIRACAAHMGTYQVEEFLAIAREYDRVYLDTTFAMSAVATEYMDFDPASIADETLIELSASIMYGSDFPNIPYPYHEERAHLLERDLPAATQRDIFAGTVQKFLGETA